MMVIIRNSNDQTFCYPGTDTPIKFDSFEAAEQTIANMGLSDASAVGLEDDDDSDGVEERYGGENDLW